MGGHRARPHLRIAFVSFWNEFDADENPYVDSLRRLGVSFEVVENVRGANLVFFSKHGQAHRRYAATKVFCTVENLRPAWSHTDFAIGHDHNPDRRYLRFPYFAYVQVDEEARPLEIESAPPDWRDRAFCAFLYSHKGPPERAELFELMQRHAPVESAGAFLHNADPEGLTGRYVDWRRGKLAYLQQFRYVIACENSTRRGYVTEKLFDALAAGAIPIYWGAPDVGEDFHTECFVPAQSAEERAALPQIIAALDADERAAERILSAPSAKVRTEEWERRLDEFMRDVTSAVPNRTTPSQRVRAARLTLTLSAATARARISHRLIRFASRDR